LNTGFWLQATLQLTANGQSYTKKYFFLLAFVSNELLTLMPADLPYSASFPPRRLAFSI